MTVELMQDQFPVRKDSIEELVGHRNRSLEMARQGIRMLRESVSAGAASAPSISYSHWLSSIEIRGRRVSVDDEDIEEDVRRVVDEYAWSSLLKISGLRNLMDATGHEELSQSLRKNPPPFTAENVTSTFMQAAMDAPQILERSVVRVFSSLRHKRYKSMSKFGIGKKAIFEGALSKFGGWNSYGWSQKMVGDMDRLFHVLDGKKPPEAGDITDLIGQQHRKKSKTCESEYFHCKMFWGNGNLHIVFKRPDLVEKVNRILTKHFGTTLPDDRKVA